MSRPDQIIMLERINPRTHARTHTHKQTKQQYQRKVRFMIFIKTMLAMLADYE